MKKCRYLIAFFIPIITFILVLYLKTGNINGNYILISDMEAQYNSLLQYLKNILDGEASLFYSFNKGLGGEMFTAFTYYFSSPLNLLVYFFKESQIPNCVLLIILIKIGLSGLNMNIYLNNKKDNNNSNLNLLFSLCYALMGYIVNYYFNIMWLDAVYMLPLVILGLEKLIDNKRPIMYILALAYTIICNYYTGYMICLFCLVYFIYQLVIRKLYDKKIIKIFIISSLLATGIGSFILIPTIIQLSSFANTQGSININIEYIYSIFEGILKNILIGGHNCTEVMNKYGVYLFITNLNFILVILYMLNKNINKREKVASLIIILFFLASFLLLPLTYIWHGFSLPASFNNRQSFILCFFLITISKKSYDYLGELTIKKMFVVVFIYIIISVFQMLLIGSNVINNILITVLFVILYLYLLYIKNKCNKKYISVILFIFVFLELFINTYTSFVSKTVVTTSYQNYVENICPIVSSFKNEYRTENTIGKNGMDGITCNYQSTTLFLSTLTNNDIEFFHNYGYFGGGKIIYNSGDNTLFMDSILGIKYYYDENKKDNTEKRDSTCQLVNFYDEDEKNIIKKEYCLYENKYASSLGYYVNDIEVTVTDNVFENQNNLFHSITANSADILKKIEYQKYDEFEYEVVNNKNKFYLYMESERSSNDNDIEFYINDEKKELVTKIEGLNNIIEINSDEGNTKIEIKGKDTKYIKNIYFYQIDEEIVIDELNDLNNQRFNISSINKNEISGEIEINDNGYILFTIPFDKNIEIYVDGKEQETIKAYDYFTAIEIKSGKHDIYITYNKKIYYISAFISLISIVISAVFVKKCKKNNKNIKK